MNTYIIFFRGINVGGKNKVPMAALRKALESVGFQSVSTYIASGNVILDSDKSKHQVKEKIEQLLSASFTLDSDLIKVLVITPAQLKNIIENKPRGFGESPNKYHSDVVFLLDISSKEAMKAFDPREGVDAVWQGKGVVYSQRLSSQLTKSRLSKITASPLYKSMTIRNWNTTTKMLELLTKQGNS